MLDTFVALPPRFPALLWSPYLWRILGMLCLCGYCGTQYDGLQLNF